MRDLALSLTVEEMKILLKSFVEFIMPYIFALGFVSAFCAIAFYDLLETIIALIGKLFKRLRKQKVTTD